MKLAFGGVIAVILLALYGYSVGFAVVITSCLGAPGCKSFAASDFTTGFASTMSVVGGLVAALVIAELAVTQPGKAPVARVLADNASVTATRALTIVTSTYLLAWIIIGVGAYVVGVLWYPHLLEPLTTLGEAWLGLAVASAYAYFGLQQKK